MGTLRLIMAYYEEKEGVCTVNIVVRQYIGFPKSIDRHSLPERFHFILTFYYFKEIVNKRDFFVYYNKKRRFFTIVEIDKTGTYCFRGEYFELLHAVKDMVIFHNSDKYEYYLINSIFNEHVPVAEIWKDIPVGLYILYRNYNLKPLICDKINDLNNVIFYCYNIHQKKAYKTERKTHITYFLDGFEDNEQLEITKLKRITTDGFNQTEFSVHIKTNAQKRVHLKKIANIEKYIFTIASLIIKNNDSPEDKKSEIIVVIPVLHFKKNPINKAFFDLVDIPPFSFRTAALFS